MTAKSVNNITSSIKVNVYSKVTGLELKEENIVLQEQTTYQVIPIVLPDDASNPKVDFSSSNEQVATIDQNGNITALKEGKTTIQVITQEGNYQKEFELIVIPKLEEGAIEFEEELEVKGNQITGIKEKMTVKELKGKITSKYTIEIQDANGKILKDTDLVGTNTKIIFKEDEKIIIQYYIILYGDVNRRRKN
ncbi:MAG: Ig-like domain-containing protein [Clostridia bacterium]|nr:Ig-like domain-containing protein [Clostridia bacterium]